MIPAASTAVHTHPILPKFGVIWRIFLPVYHRPSIRAGPKIFIWRFCIPTHDMIINHYTWFNRYQLNRNGHKDHVWGGLKSEKVQLRNFQYLACKSAILTKAEKNCRKTTYTHIIYCTIFPFLAHCVIITIFTTAVICAKNSKKGGIFLGIRTDCHRD